ncbi:hypothetical protein [Candidatus Hodgkinia cicadicola]|uniref:hypothetical protein n=1 Tax=Candidatus Hodgkinia cicadicola TaxID=573658 RepID=UPI002415947E
MKNMVIKSNLFSYSHVIILMDGTFGICVVLVYRVDLDHTERIVHDIIYSIRY